ncbi:MAG: C2 family cysteine protease [Myxococcota bacterium]
MPSRIRDSQIRSFTSDLRNSPSPKIDDTNVLRLLAAVGDGVRWNGTRLLSELTRGGISRQEQLDLAKRGLSANERMDIADLLDQSSLEMTPGAKNFLEALVGRAPLQSSFGALTITGDQRDGIFGTAKPGDKIEAINLSSAPSGRLHLADTMEIGRADQHGKFSGNLPDLKEGDIVRLRTRSTDGSTSDWVTIKAKGLAAVDGRNAEVNLERIDLAATGDGKVSVTHNTARPLSEPGARLRFTNTRTGAHQDVQVNENGSIPAGLQLDGKAGDSFLVAATDGTNNVTFATAAGTLRVPGGDTGPGGVDLPDPKPLKDDQSPDGASRYKLTRFTGPLFKDNPSSADVRQGAIGDCYFPAAMAAVAHMKPEVIRELIKDNGDGTYTVTFKPHSFYGPSEPVEIKVDGDLYARSWGGPVYGSSLGGSTDADKMELWFPLVEKAYAQMKGGYEAIGNGGMSGSVMATVLGEDYRYESIGPHNKESLWERIKAAEQSRYPMTAGTYGKDEAERYTNTGVYANHAYSVLGVEEENGVKYVKLRNPWGQSEPGWDGNNDGYFRLELDKFAQLYSNFAVVEK